MYKIMDDSIIENTLMEKNIDENTGEILSYRITPNEGYKLHEITRDNEILDENGNPTGEKELGFTKGIVTTSADYDFEKNEREIYAVKDDNN